MIQQPTEAQVLAVAHQFAGSSPTFPTLLTAVIAAEGNILRAVQCSEPQVTTLDEALAILARSACHAMSDFLAADPDRAKAFVQSWAKTWAPVGATNDPTNLNANWPINVDDHWIPRPKGT